MSTQIRGNKQIKNITIENEQLVNGTIELNKLKDGAELIKRDGSVPFTGDIDAGSHKIVNLAEPVNANDAVRKADLDAVAEQIGGTLITREIVSGTKDGQNVTFTLAQEPTLATEQIFFNGALLNAGVAADYTISGNVITFAVAPQAGDSILANYVVDAIQLNVDVQATLNQINGRVGLVEADMASAEADIAALESADTAMDVRVTAAEADIASLETRATNLETNVDAVEADIAAEESRAMAAESALDVRVSSSEVEILGLKTRMTAAEGDIDDLEAADVAMDSRVGNIEDGLQAETTARTNAVSSLNTRVTALETADTDVDSRLDVLETDVAALETDLTAEAATRLANDNTLQSNINAEIANRTSAVSAVQSNLNAEIADRAADVDAEETRALAAESALDVRIDALEVDPVTKTYVDAQDSALSDRIDALEADPVSQAYVDQKIADLVNSAPAVLDTLKELSDALGGDENFATTIAADIAAVDDRVDTVVADLAQEAIDRAADVDAEETRAMAAESVLDVRIDALEADPVTKTYVDGEVSGLDARVDALESAPPPVTALSYLSDVTVASPSNGQVLQYNGTEWVNGPAPSTFSGSYNDLSNKPDLSVYALDTDVAAIDTRVEALEDNAFVTREIPSGSINGSNAVFTLANTPVSGSEQVFVNGMLQESGAGNDYTISGGTITFASAPLSGWKVHVSYATGSYLVAPAGASSSGLSAEIYQDAQFTWSGGDTTRIITHNKGRQPDMIKVFVQNASSIWTEHYDLSSPAGSGANYGWYAIVPPADNNSTRIRLFNTAGTGPTRIRLYWFGTQGVGDVSSSGGWL